MKKIVLIVTTVFAVQLSIGQEFTNPITTGVPFLQVAADARSAALGDQGVATSSDVFSQQYNPAKYAFAIDKQGISLSYTPYLTSLVNDIKLAQITYYNRIDERSAFAVGFRYFGLGDIEFRDASGGSLGVVTPNELALDGSYSLKLSEKFGMAVAGRYINSNLRFQDDSSSPGAKPASSFAVDIAGFYQSEEIAFNDFNGRFRAGFNFQNLGPKISYDSDKKIASNLPSNFKFGAGFDFILDDFNKIAISAEFNKLLVPTPQEPKDLNGDGVISQAEKNENYNTYKSIPWTSGVFKSFGDAPGGFSEELKEYTYSIGSEYLYQDQFAFRLGYFHESPVKGARQFVSVGAGFRYENIKIDLSYLFSASKIKSPLENTLRFSLTFNFGEKYDEY